MFLFDFCCVCSHDVCFVYTCYFFFPYFFFFFKQNTAYEMRMSDWSSDACSSDLDMPRHQLTHSRSVLEAMARTAAHQPDIIMTRQAIDQEIAVRGILVLAHAPVDQRGIGEIGEAPGKEFARSLDHGRSEERRVGNEGVSTCRIRGSAIH